jgi:nucleotide-binding universal stress UspA family protein
VFKTIAWATDSSPSARNALTIAKGLARDLGAKLVIIYVQELAVARPSMFIDSDEAAVAALHRTAEQLRGEGIEVSVMSARASTGDVARTLTMLAEEADADLIVVGNRGHGPVATLMLGSVASRLLKTARCPVLTVPSRQQPKASPAAADAAAESTPPPIRVAPSLPGADRPSYHTSER